VDAFKNALAALDVIPEEWGGDHHVSGLVSAKVGYWFIVMNCAKPFCCRPKYLKLQAQHLSSGPWRSCVEIAVWTKGRGQLATAAGSERLKLCVRRHRSGGVN